MQEKIIGLKILKLKEEKRKKGKNTQNCKSPMQRQRFMTTIKNMTEKKKNLKSLIRFYNAIKIDNYSKVGKGKERRKKFPKESTEQVETQE